MKKILVLFATALLLFSCKTVYVPIKGETITIDSLVVETRIDTVKVQLPPERVKDYSDLKDTLRLSTAFAISESWVDMEKGILAGQIRNIDTPLEVPVTSTNTLERKDSIVYKEVPVPVEVEKKVTPKLYPWSLGLNLFLILTIGIGTYFKFFYRK